MSLHREARQRAAREGTHEAALPAPSPDPGHSAELMAAQLLEDDEFMAWHRTEQRGLIGRR